LADRQHLSIGNHSNYVGIEGRRILVSHEAAIDPQTSTGQEAPTEGAPPTVADGRRQAIPGQRLLMCAVIVASAVTAMAARVAVCH